MSVLAILGLIVLALFVIWFVIRVGLLGFILDIALSILGSSGSSSNPSSNDSGGFGGGDSGGGGSSDDY